MKKIVTGIVTLAFAGFLWINDSSASVNSNSAIVTAANQQAFIQDTGTHKRDTTMKKKWNKGGKAKKDSTQLRP